MVRGEDVYGYDMIGEHWESCRAFLQEVREKGGRVVVHCVAGINRSALIACAGHMVLERAPVLDVVRNGMDKRGFVLWNESFQRQLCQLAAKEGLLGEKPHGYTDEPIVDVPVGPPPGRNALIRLTK